MFFTYDTKHHSFNPCTTKHPTMRRSYSLNSMTSQPSSPEWCLFFKKLNLIAFALTLVYVGYLLGCLDNGSVRTPYLTRGGRKYGSDLLRQKSSATADETARVKQRISEQTSAVVDREMANREAVPSPLVIDERPRPPETNPNGPVIHKQMGPATSINLIGERHSGTNWITDHLVACVRFTSCFGFIFAFLMMETNQSYLYRFMFLTVRRPDSCKYMEEICLK
jgi:hypothetical protein